jgi:uncharacterized protein
MRNGHRVIDSDGHMVEPPDLWDTYIDPSFYDRRPIGDAEGFGLTVDGQHLPRLSKAKRKPGPATSDILARNREPAAFIDVMDSEGIETMVLYPSRGLFAAAFTDMDDDLSAAICRAYNRWLHDFCALNPARLHGVALGALHAPSKMCEEVMYASKELGLRAMTVRPNPYRGRSLCDSAYDEFYAACAEVGTALAIHEGYGAMMETAGTERFESHALRHALSHPFEQMAAVMAFTSGGVMERHPDLRVAFLEAGGTWLPYWLHRLDEHWEKHVVYGDDVPELTQKPSDYFRRQGWIGFETDEPTLRSLVDYIGVDRLLWATDFPHVDATYPGMVDKLFKSDVFSPDELRAIAQDNPSAFYGLPLNPGA